MIRDLLVQMNQAGEYVRCQAIAARRTRHCCKKSRNQAGDVISYTSPYLIPTLLHYDYFQLRLFAYLAPYHYADTAKFLSSAGNVTSPLPPMPVK